MSCFCAIYVAIQVICILICLTKKRKERKDGNLGHYYSQCNIQSPLNSPKRYAATPTLTLTHCIICIIWFQHLMDARPLHSPYKIFSLSTSLTFCEFPHLYSFTRYNNITLSKHFIVQLAGCCCVICIYYTNIVG